MGGKAKSSNDEMIAFEKQQAAEAKAREVERQARLKSGTEQIGSIFDAANFDDAFFRKYKNAQLDYSLPQLADQYSRARDKLTYDLARAGTLRSQAAVDAAGQLSKENLVNEAGLRAAADQQAGQLRNTISNEKSAAINQLYATEDPTVAANSATGMVQQASIAQPNLNPLGALFTPIAVGGIAGLNSYIDTYNTQRGLQANPLGADKGRFTNA